MAPAGFDMCQKKGGRIRTKTLSDGRYLHICFLNGKSYPGYVKYKDKRKETIRKLAKR